MNYPDSRTYWKPERSTLTYAAAINVLVCYGKDGTPPLMFTHKTWRKYEQSSHDATVDIIKDLLEPDIFV